MEPQRGRPKEYDPEAALSAAGAVFWARGFHATSLDDLAAAMGMNRPSIYRAFGDKEAIYRKALGQFCQRMEAAMEQTLFAEADLGVGLTRFYTAALDVYTGGGQQLGCMVMSTAVSAAPSHPEVRADLRQVIGEIDRKIAQRFQQAIDEGQLDGSVDAKTLASIAQGILHSLSLRARAGEPKAKLRRILKTTTSLLEMGTGTIIS